MTAITKPTEGAPDNSLLPGGGALVGVDGNAYSVMAEVSRILKRAGASREYVDAYTAEATSGDYDHLLATSIAFIEPEGEADPIGDYDADGEFPTEGLFDSPVIESEDWGPDALDEDDDEGFTFGDAMSLRFG
jgi:hypothetical protein